MATSFHVVQRTCQVPLFLPWLAKFVFVGWNLVIVLAAITLPLGITRGKEYARETFAYLYYRLFGGS